MEIELYSLLALAILLTSVATVLFALFTYVLFRVRESRKLKKQAAARKTAESAPMSPEAAPNPAPEPAPAAKPEPVRPRFFKPYQPSN